MKEFTSNAIWYAERTLEEMKDNGECQGAIDHCLAAVTELLSEANHDEKCRIMDLINRNTRLH